MARILDQPSSNSRYYTINLHSTDLSPCPPEGLLKFDLRVNMKVKHTSLQLQDEHGNPRQSQKFCQFNFPTLRLFSTLNRSEYSSALHRWLRQLLSAHVVNDVTHHVIEHVFDNVTTSHDQIFALHVQIDFNIFLIRHDSLVELDHDLVGDDVAGHRHVTGLREPLIRLLMRMGGFPAPAKEELECKDCSICLDDLVSGDGEDKTNNLFESWQCGHIFHSECIKKWLRISDSCPLCRIALSSEIKRIEKEIRLSYRLE